MENNNAVTENNQVISKERQKILTILEKGHHDLLQKYGEFFRDSTKYPAESREFKAAVNGLLHDLILEAQQTGDTRDATRILNAFNDMGAIPAVDYARLARQLAEIQAPRALDKLGG